MNVFDLHRSVIADYRDCGRSFFTVVDDRVRAFVEQTLDAEARLWPDFLMQVSPSYDRVAKVDDLVAARKLQPESDPIFRTPDADPYYLYRHQVLALEQANAGASHIVTSGTGSGKRLTDLIRSSISCFARRQRGTGSRPWLSINLTRPVLRPLRLGQRAVNTQRSGSDRTHGRRFHERQGTSQSGSVYRRRDTQPTVWGHLGGSCGWGHGNSSVL
jgi:hypothetical protein